MTLWSGGYSSSSAKTGVEVPHEVSTIMAAISPETHLFTFGIFICYFPPIKKAHPNTSDAPC
jgi:hypothetical protein